MKLHRILAGALAACLLAAPLALPCFAANDSVVITDVRTEAAVHEDGSADVTHEIDLSFSEGSYDFSLDFTGVWGANGARAEDVQVSGAPCTLEDYGSDGYMFCVDFDTQALAGQQATAVISYRFETFDDLEPEYDLMILPLFSFSRTARVEHLTAEITLPDSLTPTDVRAVESLYVSDAASGAELDVAVSTDGGVVFAELRETMASWEDLCLALEFAPGALGVREIAERTGVRVTGSACDARLSEDFVYAVRQSLTVEIDDDADGWSLFLPLLETESSWDGCRYEDFVFTRNDGSAEYDESGRYAVFHLEDDDGTRREGTFVFEYEYTLTPRAVAANETIYLPTMYGADTTENLTFTLRAPGLTGVDTFFGGILATPKSERFEIETADGVLTVRSLGPLYEEEYLRLTPQWDADAFSRSAPAAGIAALVLAAVLAAALAAVALRARVPRPAGARSPEIPAGVTAAAAGYLCDGVVGRAELGAQIVSWAAQGAVSLRETADGGVLVSRTGALPAGAPDWERGLFDECFASGGAFEAEELSDGLRAAARRALSGVRAQFGTDVRSARFARFAAASSLLVPLVAAFAARVMLGDSLLPALAASAAALAAALPACLCAAAAAKRSVALAQSAARRTVRAVLAAAAAALSALTAAVLAACGIPVPLAVSAALAAAACAALAMRAAVPSAAALSALDGLDGLAKFLAAAPRGEIEELLREDENAFYRLLPYAVSMGLYEPWLACFSGMYLRVNASFEGAASSEDAARLAARTVLAARGE